MNLAIKLPKIDKNSSFDNSRMRSQQYFFYPKHNSIISISFQHSKDIQMIKIGGFMREQSENLQIEFLKYFNNSTNANLAFTILANDQMTIEQVSKIFPFKGNMKKEFMARTFNYGPHRLRNNQNNSDEVREMGGHSDNKFLLEFKDRLEGALEGLPQSTKHLLDTGIQEKLTSMLFDLKTQELQKGEKPYIESKTAYLVQLIQTIVEKLGKENEEGVPEKIVQYGGVQIVLNTSLFISDTSFKNRLKSIIGNCKTFNQIRAYGGKDIDEEKTQLLECISTCLINLRFEERVAQEICNELLQKPSSNIVALRPDLTNKQKETYYNSEFYRSGKLKENTQILGYSESLQFKLKQDVIKILSYIQDAIKISKEIMENVLSFNFYGLFKISNIKHMKRNIYQKIITECPYFLTAFKLVKYQGRTPASLRQNERVNQKMGLIDIFLKIKLPFQQWDKAQNKILSRDYQVVDDLTLKLDAKHTLLKHIFSKVEPFFHSQEKPLDYKTEVEHALLQLIMVSDLSDLNFDLILNIINETLSGETGYRSECVEELGKGQIRAYNDFLKNCAKFNEYKSNCGRDIKEEEYQKSWQLRKKIYENNLEDRIDVSYQNITEFIEKVISDGGKIPKVYNKYITDLSKLRGDPIVPIVEQKQDLKPISQHSSIKNEIPLPVKQTGESQQQMRRKFADLVQKFYNKYTDDNEESMFDRACLQKFDNNKVAAVRKAIEGNAFNDQNSPFFSELGWNNLLTKKIKTQFQKNASSFAAEISECSFILQKMGSAGSSAPQHPISILYKKESSGPTKAKAEEFINKYVNENEESLLQKAWLEKYGKDSLKLAKEIIALDAFSNPESSFFANLNLNKMLTKRIKGEFERNMEWAVPMLSEMK